MDIAQRAMQHLEALALTMGSRAMGTPGNRQAAEYIQGVMQEAGLETIRQEFACPAWTLRGLRLEFEGQELSAVAHPFAPACNVVAPTVAVGSVAELENALLAHRIVLLYGELSQPLAPKGVGYASERDQRVVRILEVKAPRAIISISPRVEQAMPLIEDAGLNIPSVTVPAGAGLQLLQGAGRPVRLLIDGQSVAGRSWHILGTRLGTRRQRLVICAHYDTKFGTPGALDNASGVAVLLTLAEALAGRPLPLGIEFAAFSGEEYHVQAEDAYLREQGDLSGRILCTINIDGVGQQLASRTIAAMAVSGPFIKWAADIVAQHPGTVWVGPWRSSNHDLFLARGVPCVALSSIGMADVMHRPTDTVSWMSAAQLGETVVLVRRLVEGLQDRTLRWVKG